MLKDLIISIADAIFRSEPNENGDQFPKLELEDLSLLDTKSVSLVKVPEPDVKVYPFERMLKPGQIMIEEPPFFGKIPVRSELTSIPEKMDLRDRMIGWTVHESMGVSVVNQSVAGMNRRWFEQIPLTPFDIPMSLPAITIFPEWKQGVVTFSLGRREDHDEVRVILGSMKTREDEDGNPIGPKFNSMDEKGNRILYPFQEAGRVLMVNAMRNHPRGFHPSDELIGILNVFVASTLDEAYVAEVMSP